MIIPVLIPITQLQGSTNVLALDALKDTGLTNSIPKHAYKTAQPLVIDM